MIIIVTGSRKADSESARQLVFKTLDELHRATPIKELKHGGAKGFDSFAHEWAMKNKILTRVFQADWKMYGDSAGPLRNAMMARSGADLCIAFPGGDGTKNMKRQCDLVKPKIPVKEIEYPAQ